MSSHPGPSSIRSSRAQIARRDWIFAEALAANDRLLRIAFAGLLIYATDLTLFTVFLSADFGIQESSILSFLAATVLVHTLGVRWPNVTAEADADISAHVRCLPALMVGLFALLLRSAVLELLLSSAGWSPRSAIIPAIATTASAVVAGSAFLVSAKEHGHSAAAAPLREFALFVAACSLVLRLVLCGATDLIPEEAYYWNYAQHLDFGYVDHPPMVAWMIAVSTRIFGDSEFAVRLPAIGCWLATAFFMYRWSEDYFGETSACLVLMFLATFPFYFSTGFLMTPDAPLSAAWAASLWLLARALLAAHRRAWLWVGVSAGLGMLSKYSIALLGPAAIAFILLDARSRTWLRRREPYQALAVSILLFCPVVIWNANNEWVSFLYQGPQRWSSDIDFSLHILILSALVLVTPIGLAGIIVLWLPRRLTRLRQDNAVCSERRMWLFSLVFTLIPLCVFVLHAIQDNPKIQWTGPLWLASLPLLASAIDSQAPLPFRRFSGLFSQKLWKPASAAMLLFLGGAFYAMTVGPPLLPKLERMGLPVAWEEMMQSVENIEKALEQETGRRSIVVGLSNYFISAEHAFYDPGGDGVDETGGRGLLGYNGWMWDYWQKPEDFAGHDVILLSFDSEYLDRARFEQRFAAITDARQVPIMKSGRMAGRYFYRIGYAYRPPA